MNTDGTLFSMKKNSREAEVMSMTSFMIPIGLKQKLKDHAAKLGITSTSLIIEGIRLILDRKDGATPQLEDGLLAASTLGTGLDTTAPTNTSNEKPSKHYWKPISPPNRPRRHGPSHTAPRGKMHWTSASKQNRLSTRRKTNERRDASGPTR